MSGGEATGGSSFGELLRRHRSASGLTQEELADRAGLSVRAIANMERGRTARPYAGSIQLLADALKLHGLDRERLVQATSLRPAQATTPGQDPPGHTAGDSQPPTVMLRQLPAAMPHFAGRSAELKALTSLLDADTDAARTVLIPAIIGCAGVGKTTLAVHWAHQVADRFPDGQLYLNLRGFDPAGEPVPPAEAIRGFLDALGISPDKIPPTAQAQTGLYRSLLAGRQVLIVLDNARDAAQVRPLLPGSSCVIVVTSRSQLAGLLVADGARPLYLDLLTPADAAELLTARLGPERMDEESHAAAEIIELSAGLPLALAIVAARAALSPAIPLAELAAELRAAATSRLDAMDTGEAATSLRAVFSWSYQDLSAPAARMFRLLGTHPGPDIAPAAAASLAGSTLRAARRALTELTASGLLAEHAPGRFACHDLLWVYAAELGDECDSPASRRAAIHRLLDHYLHTAHAAMLLIHVAAERLPLPPPCPGVRPEDISTDAQAMRWFTAEHDVVLAVTAEAARTGFDSHAWLLPGAIAAHLHRSGHWHEWAATQRTALVAARRLGDLHAQARVHRRQGHALAILGRHRDAHAHLRHALRLFGLLGDQAGQAYTHCAFAVLQQLRHHRRESLNHARHALHLFRATGDQLGQAAALCDMCWGHLQLGEHGHALACGQQALRLCLDAGDHTVTGDSWDSLGLAHLRLGRIAQAIECHQQAIGEYRQAGHRPLEAGGLAHLGDAQHSGGELTAAGSSWRQALAILDDLDHPDAESARLKLRHLDAAAATPSKIER